MEHPKRSNSTPKNKKPLTTEHEAAFNMTREIENYFNLKHSVFIKNNSNKEEKT